MANTKQTKKRVRQAEKRRFKNAKVKSSIRTASKKLTTAAETEGADKSALKDLYNNFVKAIDTASGKKIIHWKTAARKKSRLAKKVNAAVQSKAPEAPQTSESAATEA